MLQTLSKCCLAALCLSIITACAKQKVAPAPAYLPNSEVTVYINDQLYQSNQVNTRFTGGMCYIFSNSNTNKNSVLNLVLDNMQPGVHKLGYNGNMIRYILNDSNDYTPMPHITGRVTITAVNDSGVNGTFYGILHSNRFVNDSVALVHGRFAHLPVR